MPPCKYEKSGTSPRVQRRLRSEKAHLTHRPAPLDSRHGLHKLGHPSTTGFAGRRWSQSAQVMPGVELMICSGYGQRSSRFLVALTFIGVSACAAPVHNSTTPSAQSKPVPEQASSGTVAYLRQLIDSHQLTQLRTTFNGHYGATLFFQPDKLSYYVALFHDDAYWRVIQTDSERSAESIYSAFAQQSEKLAEVDIDALRLKAGNAYAEQMVAMNERRLKDLQRDADRQQQEAREVAAQQQRAQAQAVALSNDLRNTSSQLEAVKARIRELEAQQANPEMVLPPPPPPSATDTPPPAPNPTE